MDTKSIPLYMLPTRDLPQSNGHIQTESEGLEKDISCKWRLILISDKIDFKENQKLREFNTTKPALQQILKDIL